MRFECFQEMCIKVVYFKPNREESFDWRTGFSWLWKDNCITIKIIEDYLMNPTYLVGHELSHVKQMIENRLKSENVWTQVSYRPAVNKPYKHHKGKRLIKLNTLDAPWEIEAIKHHHKVMGY